MIRTIRITSAIRKIITNRISPNRPQRLFLQIVAKTTSPQENLIIPIVTIERIQLINKMLPITLSFLNVPATPTAL